MLSRKQIKKHNKRKSKKQIRGGGSDNGPSPYYPYGSKKEMNNAIDKEKAQMKKAFNASESRRALKEEEANKKREQTREQKKFNNLVRRNNYVNADNLEPNSRKKKLEKEGWL